MFESRISAGRLEKLPFPPNLCISSWSYDMAAHAKKCVERYCELANKTRQQLYKSIYSLHRWPPLQRGRNEICWRIVTSMLLNCCKMFILGTNWETWYSMVREQTSESIDFIRPSYMFIIGWKCETMQAGTVSRLRFCGRSWGLKIHIWRNVDCVPSFVKSSHQEALLFILWRQGSSDQDGCERKKPDDETCFQDPHSCSWLVGYSIEEIWAPQPKFHTWWVEQSFVFVQHHPFQFHHWFWNDVQKNTIRWRWKKSRGKFEADDEFGLAIQREDPNVLASTASESRRKKSESQNVLLSSLNEQQTRTRKLVMGASSSNCSEWMEYWRKLVFSRVEIWWNVGARTTSPVDVKFVIDDDMDSGTATELNRSLRLRSFLIRVNDRLRKILDRSSKDAMQDIDKRSMI